MKLLSLLLALVPFEISTSFTLPKSHYNCRNIKQKRVNTCITSTSTSKLWGSNESGETNAIPNPTSAAFVKTAVPGPSIETKPDYENIHGPLGKNIDSVFMTLFRTKMAENVGFDSLKEKNDYKGLMELTSEMNKKYSDRRDVHRIAQNVLRDLFPTWMLKWYPILFSKPFPSFAAKMNAWATKVGGTWLMGECELNDVEIDNGQVGINHGLLVKRCRFLEESGCASVCVNSCKIPTQNFFMDDMGLPLTMTPDYETYECQFAFGKTPSIQEESEAKNTPCLSRCPSYGALRKWHDNNSSMRGKEIEGPVIDNSLVANQCTLMEGTNATAGTDASTAVDESTRSVSVK